MLIREFTEGNSQAQLAALSQLLKGRASDTAAKSTISVDAFINMAKGLGIMLTRQTLVDMIAQPPLNNIIGSVRGDDIHFKGVEDEELATPSDTDENEQRVSQMAKRQLGRGR